jgi:hypothetical protein
MFPNIIDPIVNNSLLQDALNSLHKVHPELNFPSMHVLLLDAGMNTLDDLVVCGVPLIVQ